MKNPIVWIEIPVVDMPRAVKFYKDVFQWELSTFPMGPLLMTMLPSDPAGSGTSGALVYHPKGFYKVSTDQSGPVVYLECERIDEILENIVSSGGSVIQAKKLISEDHGSMALFYDSEGNRMALYSNER